MHYLILIPFLRWFCKMQSLSDVSLHFYSQRMFSLHSHLRVSWIALLTKDHSSLCSSIQCTALTPWMILSLKTHKETSAKCSFFQQHYLYTFAKYPKRTPYECLWFSAILQLREPTEVITSFHSQYQSHMTNTLHLLYSFHSKQTLHSNINLCSLSTLQSFHHCSFPTPLSQQILLSFLLTYHFRTIPLQSNGFLP